MWTATDRPRHALTEGYDRGVSFTGAVKAAVCALALGLACTAGTPPGGGSYLRGAGALADDWRTAGPLQESRTRPSDLVGLWQGVLWADGYLPKSQVTCGYDAATAAATRTWQSNHQLSADGIVGPASFGAAGERLADTPPWTVYRGERYDLPLHRDAAGYYEVWDVGRFRRLRTDEVTLARCGR